MPQINGTSLSKDAKDLNQASLPHLDTQDPFDPHFGGELAPVDQVAACTEVFIETIKSLYKKGLSRENLDPDRSSVTRYVLNEVEDYDGTSGTLFHLSSRTEGLDRINFSFGICKPIEITYSPGDIVECELALKEEGDSSINPRMRKLYGLLLRSQVDQHGREFISTFGSNSLDSVFCFGRGVNRENVLSEEYYFKLCKGQANAYHFDFTEKVISTCVNEVHKAPRPIGVADLKLVGSMFAIGSRWAKAQLGSGN